MMRGHWLARATVLVVGVLAVLSTPPAREVTAAVVAQPWTITGVDAHDGMVYQDGGVYYLVGTKYGCGFQYGVANTPFCGMVVYSAPAATGPWTYVRELFNRAIGSPYMGQSWQYVCGDGGDGCFNPRMTRRPDGVWILSFNAPGDYRRHLANGYYVMGCNGPAGPCGSGGGLPYASTIKPAMYICSGGEDYNIVVDASVAYMVCTRADRTLAIERLDGCYCNGVNTGATNLAGLSYVEGPAIHRDPDGSWILTYGANCPYCTGTDTSYAVSANVTGPYSTPGNPAAQVPPDTGRRVISPHSCGGQPRSVARLDGDDYQMMDVWLGRLNETTATLHFEPFVHTGQPYGADPSGVPWIGPFKPFACTG